MCGIPGDVPLSGLCNLSSGAPEDNDSGAKEKELAAEAEAQPEEEDMTATEPTVEHCTASPTEAVEHGNFRLLSESLM